MFTVTNLEGSGQTLSLAIETGMIGIRIEREAGSYLARLLAGVRKPEGGSVQADPDGVVGFAPAAAPMPFGMSVVRFMEHMGRLRGLQEDEAGEKAASILTLCGLEELGSSVINQRTRTAVRHQIALLAAMMGRTNVVIAEAPTDDLLDDETEVITDLLAKMKEDYAVVVLESNPDVLALCETVIDRTEGESHDEVSA